MKTHTPVELLPGISFAGTMDIVDHKHGTQMMLTSFGPGEDPIGGRDKEAICARLLLDLPESGLELGDEVMADVTLEATDFDIVIAMIDGEPAVMWWEEGVDAVAVVTHSYKRPKYDTEV